MRNNARYLVKKKARLHVAGQALEGVTQDMHELGIRVRIPASEVSSELVGAQAELELEFDSHGVVNVPCTVRRVIGSDVGLSFETLQARAEDGRILSLDELIPPSAPML